MRTPLVFAVCLLLTVACAPATQSSVGAGGVGVGVGVGEDATSGIRLIAQPAGETVRLTLTNGTSETVGYNLCHSLLERSSGGAWSEVRTDEVCTMELRMLQPGGSASIDKRWPPNAGTGTFRYRTRVEAGGEGREVFTDSFAR